MSTFLPLNYVLTLLLMRITYPTTLNQIRIATISYGKHIRILDQNSLTLVKHICW